MAQEMDGATRERICASATGPADRSSIYQKAGAPALNLDTIDMPIGCWLIIEELRITFHGIPRLYEHLRERMDIVWMWTWGKQAKNIRAISITCRLLISDELKLPPILWHADDLEAIFNGVICHGRLVGESE